MTVIPKSTGREPPVIEDGLYDLYCVSAQVEESRDDDGNPQPDQFGKWQFVRFLFDVVGCLDAEGEVVRQDARVSMSLSDGSGGKYPASNLYKITQALGVDVSEGFDTDDASGRKCKGMITTKEPGAWPHVVQWMPLQKAAGATAKPVTAPAKASASKGASAHEHDPTYTANGDLICSICKVALDPQEEQAKEPDFTAFWKRVRAGKLDTPDVVKIVGDLRKVADMSQDQLNEVLARLGV